MCRSYWHRLNASDERRKSLKNFFRRVLHWWREHDEKVAEKIQANRNAEPCQLIDQRKAVTRRVEIDEKADAWQAKKDQENHRDEKTLQYNQISSIVTEPMLSAVVHHRQHLLLSDVAQEKRIDAEDTQQRTDVDTNDEVREDRNTTDRDITVERRRQVMDLVCDGHRRHAQNADDDRQRYAEAVDRETVQVLASIEHDTKTTIEGLENVRVEQRAETRAIEEGRPVAPGCVAVIVQSYA